MVIQVKTCILRHDKHIKRSVCTNIERVFCQLWAPEKRVQYMIAWWSLSVQPYTSLSQTSCYDDLDLNVDLCLKVIANFLPISRVWLARQQATTGLYAGHSLLLQLSLYVMLCLYAFLTTSFNCRSLFGVGQSSEVNLRIVGAELVQTECHSCSYPTNGVWALKYAIAAKIFNIHSFAVKLHFFTEKNKPPFLDGRLHVSFCSQIININLTCPDSLLKFWLYINHLLTYLLC